MMTTHGRWQDLPSDLGRSISEALSGDDEDLVRLGKVCRPWSEALTGFWPAAFLPWLVPTASALPTSNEYELPMYSPNRCRFNRFPVPTPLLPGRSRVVGCRHWWLVNASLRVHLFNPVTGHRADLPSFSTLNDARVRVKKVALSSTPSSSSSSSARNIVAAAVYSRSDNVEEDEIVFANVGDAAWSYSLSLPFRSVVIDVVYYRGNFFVVSLQGQYQIITPNGFPALMFNPRGGVEVASGLDPLHDHANC